MWCTVHCVRCTTFYHDEHRGAFTHSAAAAAAVCVETHARFDEADRT